MALAPTPYTEAATGTATTNTAALAVPFPCYAVIAGFALFCRRHPAPISA